MRITSLVGGLDATSHKQIGVGFTYHGLPYTDQPHIVDGLQPVTVKLPVFGTTTTVVHGIYPSRVLLTNYEYTAETRNGNMHDVQGTGGRKITVEGRVVYRDRNPPFTLLSEEFVKQHPRHAVNVEIVPNDLQQISCTL